MVYLSWLTREPSLQILLGVYMYKDQAIKDGAKYMKSYPGSCSVVEECFLFQSDRANAFADRELDDPLKKDGVE